MPKILTQQYVLSFYSDGTLKITERALTRRNTLGQFTGIPRKCANCIYRLAALLG